jgi:hypothetical protein
MTKVSNGGREEILKPIKKGAESGKQYKTNNPSLEKAKRVLALLASHC